MSDQWTDRLAGARMQVDKRFSDRVTDSRFTNQEWGLIMTAVEFDIDDPTDPETAELVATTDQLGEIIPELGKIQEQMGGSPEPVESGPSGGSIFGRVRQYIDGLTTDSREGNEREKLAAATELVEEYTVELQQYLEEQGSWEDLCSRAAAAEQ